jgi:hypothetical protein
MKETWAHENVMLLMGLLCVVKSAKVNENKLPYGYGMPLHIVEQPMLGCRFLCEHGSRFAQSQQVTVSFI